MPRLYASYTSRRGYHSQYGNLSPADLPGVRLLVDGRRINPAKWQGTPRLVVGCGMAD